MNLLLATPTMHQLVSAGFSHTVAALGWVCAKHNIKWGYETADTQHVIDARNSLVKQFLSTAATHILFCDSDSQVGPTAIEKVITSGFPFASLPFCIKRIDLKALGAYAQQQVTYEQAIASSLKWCLDLLPGETEIHNGWIKAKRTGFGFVLLERRMLDWTPDGWFDRLYEQDGATFASEDMAFCERVKHIATPMLCVDQVTHHNGTFSFGARLLDDQRYFMKRGA